MLKKDTETPPQIHEALPYEAGSAREKMSEPDLSTR